MKVIHHGARTGVTGSCHELVDEQCRLLVDCGVFQGKEKSASPDIEFDIKGIQALLITHAHIDHIGRIPWLLAAGYNGPIYASEATAHLVPIMLDDGLKIQLGLNKEQRKRFLDIVNTRMRPIPYHCWVQLSQMVGPPVKFRFTPAGHILGSSIVEIETSQSKRVVFSGDLGSYGTSLLPDPSVVERADMLVLESTYGGKRHEGVDTRQQALKAIIERSFENGGAILIPAFSIGRTQELLFDIENIIAHSQPNGPWQEIPIILDSPLAAKVTEQYQQFKRFWSAEAKERLDAFRHPMAFESCVRIETHDHHEALVERLRISGEPAVVIASSGMCTGGRIVNYLKALLPNNNTDVILAGYQAEGTLGAQLLAGNSNVKVDNKMVDVKAQVHALSGYSAHADSQDLIRFVTEFESEPKVIRLVHGSPDAQKALAEKLRIIGANIDIQLGCES
ncbi:MBL fold metallo-hydrolase RNA specificity domain-containing protein [Thaumasiovibrio subtropicus]|uniref:MBL fold metallo-hydrolase RNA specificity domain-containing protein n=1 Tax=Thaumasiovibrio subtropicus TaxID=1891207 RepID=UPI000B363BA8|nr:MBL fold metallo-hydrolase [Thaumasiovibrio subtropicus]